MMFTLASGWTEFLAILACLCPYPFVEARSQFIYMTNYCSMSVSVDSSLVLDLTAPDSLGEERTGDFVHCDVDVLAPGHMTLLVHVLRLAISAVPDHSDRLQLYGGPLANTRLTPIKGLYGTLDTSLSIFDNSGRKVKDYKTSSNKLKVDYLGKPTRRAPGFRLVITACQAPTAAGECPPQFYPCRRASVCVMRQVVCDGNPNCGKDDDSDENQCHRFDTVTNLLAQYSLTRDIITVILLPVLMFLAVVLVAYLAARHYITHRIQQPETTVHFRKDGQIQIANKHMVCNPPYYEDIRDMGCGCDPPPEYAQLAISVAVYDRTVKFKEQANEVGSEMQKVTGECELQDCALSGSRSSENTKWRCDGCQGLSQTTCDIIQCNSPGRRSMWISETDDKIVTNEEHRKRDKRKVKMAVDNENGCFVNDAIPDDAAQDNLHSSMKSRIVRCSAEESVYVTSRAASKLSHVPSYCQCRLEYVETDQPMDEIYMHYLNTTRCSNCTQ